MPRRPTELRGIPESSASTTMKQAGLFSPAVAVGGSARLLGYLLLLLAHINFCSSQKVLSRQVGKIADSVQTLADSVKAQERTSERLTSGLIKVLSFLASDYLPCEEGWLKLGTSCYFLSEDTSSWQESREKCIAKNSDLVKVATDEEYNFLRDLVKGHTTWVGLTDLDVEGTFLWTDGTVHSTIESWWLDGEPNNHEGNEHCVMYWVSGDDRWNDATCKQKFRYICEKSVNLILD